MSKVPAAASDLSVSSNVLLAALRDSGFIGVLVSSGAHCSATSKHIWLITIKHGHNTVIYNTE